MQVSGFDTVPPSGNERDDAKPATAASDAFANFLQSSFEPRTNPGLLRLADASGLVRQLSASRESFTEALPAEETAARETVEFDDEDTDDTEDTGNTAPAPDNVTAGVQVDEAVNPVGPEETVLLLADTRISPELPIPPVGAPVVAIDGRSNVVNQQPAATRPAAAEAPAGAPASPSNDANPNNPNAGLPRNGGANSGIPATLTDPGQQFVSRPANTLAAASALAAQTGRATVSADAATSGGAPSTTATTGNLLLSDSGGRAMYQGNGQRGAAQSASTIASTPTEITTNSNAPTASFAASVATNQASLQPAAPRPLPSAQRAASTAPLEPAALGGPASSSASLTRAGAAPLAARSAPPPPPSALREQISVQVQRAVAQGVDRISIQLKPAELGRLEIKLEITQDGRVSALVTVERTDTLELLQRDARGLQQALQDAGLKTDANGLNFNLRGDGTAPDEQAADGGGAADQNGADSTNGDELAENQDESAHRRASDSLIDVEV